MLNLSSHKMMWFDVKFFFYYYIWEKTWSAVGFPSPILVLLEYKDRLIDFFTTSPGSVTLRSWCRSAFVVTAEDIIVKRFFLLPVSGRSVWVWGGLHWSNDVRRPAGPVYSHPGAGDPHCRWQQGRCENHQSFQPHPAWSQRTRQGGAHLVPAAFRSR